jgi:NADH dehydrogenase
MENPREEFYEAAKPAPVAAASNAGEKAKAS